MILRDVEENQKQNIHCVTQRPLAFRKKHHNTDRPSEWKSGASVFVSERQCDVGNHGGGTRHLRCERRQLLRSREGGSGKLEHLDARLQLSPSQRLDVRFWQSSRRRGKGGSSNAVSTFLNGLTTLHTSPGVVLAADSFLGVIFAVDVRTGAYNIAINDPALKPNVSTVTTLGVNGIHIHNNDLYFTNSLSAPLFAKVPLSKDGTAAGPVEVIAEKPQYAVDDGFQADDFALDHEGAHAWIVTNPTGDLVKVDIATGAQEVVAGGLSSPTFAGATAAAFGRTKKDREILYVVTDGGAVDATASGLRGGRIVAFDTRE